MAKILLDTSKLNPLNKNRGIGTYARYLSQYLPKATKKHQIILTASQPQSVDLIHYPYFDLFFHTLPVQKQIKQIVTVHDLIPLKFPQHFKPGIKGKLKQLLQVHALKTAAAIITDSQASKSDICSLLKIAAQKVHVIPLAAADEFKPQQTSPPIAFSNPYLLYVGDVNYNKNLKSLITAFSKIKNKNVQLVLVSSAWNQPIEPIQQLNQLIQKLNLSSRITTIAYSLKTAQLASLYSHAKAYIQPSLYEGFGLPLLEAMACGTPVVSSNTSSLPEVAGSAAIQVNPTVKGLTQGMNQVLSLAPSTRQYLIKKGLNQAQKFSWVKTARDTIRVYEQVLGIRN